MEMHADDDFSKSFDFASGATAERFQNPLWPITEIFLGHRFRKSISVVKDFGRRIVASAVQNRKEQQSKDDTASTTDHDSKLDQISGSLIQSLLEALGNEQHVADAALTYLSAGRDTTGQALTWTFYLLLQHPEAVSKIRAEVAYLLSQHHQTPSQPSPSSSPSQLTSDGDIHEINTTLFTPTSLPYTTAVFHESLRLYPPIPFEIRQCQAPTTLPDGTFLPKDAVLVWCLWAMQRSRLTWGDDADEFRPERFLVSDSSTDTSAGDDGGDGEDCGNGNVNGESEGKEKGKGKVKFVLGKTSAEFPVFYGGARACLGRKMAEAIAAQVIPTVVWGFEVEKGWEGSVEGRKSQTSLTLPMEGGLPVRVRKRAGGEVSW
jgi:cytochrome P450